MNRGQDTGKEAQRGYSFELVMDIRPKLEKTNMDELENQLKNEHFDGVSWGVFERTPLVGKVDSLKAMCVFDSDKTSQSDIIANINRKYNPMIQSIDVIALNKI